MNKILFISLCTISLLYPQFREQPGAVINPLMHTNHATVSVPKKSPAIAILLSAAVPGLGEWYAGDYNTGKYFTYAEGAFWLTYLGMSTYSGWQKENYLAFSRKNGSAPSSTLDADFYANMGNYSSVAEYNNEMAFQRKFSVMYDVTVKYWDWKSASDRKNYRRMWVASQESNNNLRFVAGAMLLNRLASIINAIRLTTKFNREIEEQKSAIFFDYSPLSHNEGIFTVNLVTVF